VSTLAPPASSCDQTQTARPLEPLVFKARAELRRSAVYFLVGMALISAVCWGLSDLIPRSGGGMWRLFPCALLSLVPIAVLSWRLRVDASGIWRRRLWIWGKWPWEAFEQGMVLDSEAESKSYVFPQRPFWDRKLDLGLLEDPDCERIESIIVGIRLRPSLDLPSELALRYGFRKETLLTIGGLILRDHGDETHYAWKDICNMRIRRYDRGRRDFESLEVVLPDRVVSFSVRRHDGQLIRSWSGAGGHATPTAEILLGVLERWVPKDRILVTSLSDPPLTESEWQDRQSVLAKRARELRILRWIVGAGTVGLLLLSLWKFRDGMLSGVAMLAVSAFVAGFMVALLWFCERDHRQAIAELAASMPEL
jgi:hypothetical protein